MSEAIRTVSRPTEPACGNWWKAPLISSLAGGALLLPVTGLRGFAEMATDPCSGPDSCPATYAQLHFADYSLLAVVVLIVLQWPAAYLLPRARVAISFAPAAALAVVLLTVPSIKPGA
ncbi:hypothetical protein ACIG5E_36405 [Kitasatospora sp. NPDC053057]|uniref:hypothetical protein n=1 Tax=Kitasatospora sp. NPDC053057 TaxID=3364062 RepID=UPI0037CCB31C